jgi:predicted translin family RNA/ssDNA-binding protein
MLNKKDFEDMRKEYHLNDKLREELIKTSRDLLKISKQLIYAVHKGDMKNCAAYSKKSKTILNNLKNIIKKSPSLEFSGAFKAAVEEYAEAMVYYGFVKTGKIITHKSLNINPEIYLMGLSDFTGELVRKAVFLAGKGEVSKVVKIKDLVDAIYGEMIGFDLRSGELRKKFDSIKYNLKKLESLVLDLQIKKR